MHPKQSCKISQLWDKSELKRKKSGRSRSATTEENIESMDVTGKQHKLDSL